MMIGRTEQVLQRTAGLVLLGSVLLGPAETWAQSPTQTPDGSAPTTVTVPRVEFDQLRAEVRELRTALKALTDRPTRTPTPEASTGQVERLRTELRNIREQVFGLEKQIESVKSEPIGDQERAAVIAQLMEEFEVEMDPLLHGLTNFVISGAAVVGFQDRDNSDSTFGVGIAPVFLWKPTDRLFFETEIAFGLGREETEVELDYAQVSYIINDYLTIGGGKFLLPFGTFWERWHPSWINKLPTMPLLYERGLVGSSGLGVQLRGGVPIGPTKINYAAYLINGPDFNTSFVSAGRLGFANHRDNNNNKSFGGRIGFLPIPELEFGGSLLSGRVGSSSGADHGVDTLALGIDLSYAREIDAIKGRLDLRAEYVWVNTDDAIFAGPVELFTFNNRRNGWFVQAAYRPTQVDVRLGDRIELKNFEFALRYDQLRQPGPDRLGVDRDQITFGIDYWILPNAVLKTGYVFDDAHGGEERDGFFVQMAVSF